MINDNTAQHSTAAVLCLRFTDGYTASKMKAAGVVQYRVQYSKERNSTGGKTKIPFVDLISAEDESTARNSVAACF